MSIKYVFRKGIYYITARGKINKRQLDEAFQQMRLSPEFQRCRGIFLVDEHTLYVPSITEIKSTAFGLRESIGGFSGKIAVVVFSSVKYGLGRVMESLSTDQNMRVFKSLEPAERWMMEQ